MINAHIHRRSASLGLKLAARATQLAKAYVVDRTAVRKRSITHWQNPQFLWPLFGKG